MILWICIVACFRLHGDINNTMTLILIGSGMSLKAIAHFTTQSAHIDRRMRAFEAKISENEHYYS